jgi:hypothetical protein
MWVFPSFIRPPGQTDRYCAEHHLGQQAYAKAKRGNGLRLGVYLSKKIGRTTQLQVVSRLTTRKNDAFKGSELWVA